MIATNNELNELDHVVIRDAGKEPYTHGGQGGLVLGNAGIGHGKIKLTNSQIINNREYGLVMTNSSTTNQHNLTIKNNIIRENEMPVYATAFNMHFIDNSTDLTNNEPDEIIVAGSSNATHNTSLDGTWYNHNIPYSFTSSVYVDSKITIQDRKSTRLNSSHVKISYAVFCLKKKNTPITRLCCTLLELT